MTYTFYELHKVKCDKCGKTIARRFNNIFESNFLARQNVFITDLHDRGWVCNKEHQICPKCLTKEKEG